MKLLSIFTSAVLAIIPFCTTNALAEIKTTHLTVEGRGDSPLGLDIINPRLGWQLEATANEKDVMQQSYHILVASHPDTLYNNRGDLWDTTVKSNQSQWITYSGKKIQTNQRAYWKVQTVVTHKDSKKKITTPWSEVSSWGRGLGAECNWKAVWIGIPHAMPWDVEDEHSRLSARYYRSNFSVNNKPIKHATLHIAGLGLFEAFINGSRIGDDVLAPAPTDYRKGIIYQSYDITDNLKDNNQIDVTVSNGRYYTMQQNKKPQKIANFGYPTLRATVIVEYTDGSKDQYGTNNKTWKVTANGPVRSSNEYDGEIYDSNICIDDSTTWTMGIGWQMAERTAIPTGELRGNLTSAMRVLETIEPKSIIKTRDNRILIDFGQNMAGWMRINLKELGIEKNDTVIMRFAERLSEGDGYTMSDTSKLYIANLRHAQVTDRYIANGKEESWAPRFCYHGFRYAEIALKSPNPKKTFSPNVPKTICRAEVVGDPMETAYTFNTNDSLLNRIIQNAYWGVRSNFKGMPVDCPQRDERQPWTGDHSMGCWGESYLMNVHSLYAKWMQDLEDSQRPDGTLPGVAPAFWNYYNDDITWPSVFVFGAEMLYMQYGDVEPMKKHYDAMKKWLMHFWEYHRDAETGVVKADKYADWCCPPESPELIHSQDPNRKTDGTLIGSCYLYKLMGCVDNIGKIIGRDENNFGEIRKELRDAINKQFLTVKPNTAQTDHYLYPDSVFYSNNTVTANLLPWAFGIVPDEHRDTVERWIVRRHLLQADASPELKVRTLHIQCGVIGMSWLLRSLAEMGRQDLAWCLATSDSYPSWGYMVRKNATTIWELWNGDTANPAMNSGNHIMLLGDLVPWCMETVAGIKAKDPGYKKVELSPIFNVAELNHAQGSYKTPYGLVKSEWSKTDKHVSWDFTIPANTTAEVHINDKIVEYGSGTYHIEFDLTPVDSHVVCDQFVYDMQTAPSPSCHSASIAELPNGDLMCCFFMGAYESSPDVCVYTSRKRKGSDKWDPLIVAADGLLKTPLEDGTTRKACYNPVLFQIPGGDLLLFYKIGKNVRDWTGYMMRSSDNGHTWSEPQVELTPATVVPQGYTGELTLSSDSLLGAIKNQPLYLPKGFKCKNGMILKNNRIVSPTSKETDTASKVKAGQWRCYTEVSEDDGKTWTLSPVVPDPNHIGMIQPALLIHKDGRLQMLCRTHRPKPDALQNARIATSFSDDGGMTWSPMQLIENLPNNNSGIGAVTMPDGTFALIYNPFPCVDGPDKPLRNPCCIAVSKDGLNWNKVITLESSPISQYSYPSLLMGSDGYLHAIYTWRRQCIKYQKIRL